VDEQQPPRWFREAVGDGLQRLVALALPGAPPAETVRLTAAGWVDALWSAPIAWDEALDRARIEAAFLALMRRADRWPAPCSLLDALPSRPARRSLPRPAPSKAAREAGLRHLREVSERLFGRRAKAGDGS